MYKIQRLTERGGWRQARLCVSPVDKTIVVLENLRDKTIRKLYTIAGQNYPLGILEKTLGSAQRVCVGDQTEKLLIRNLSEAIAVKSGGDRHRAPNQEDDLSAADLQRSLAETVSSFMGYGC